MPIKSTNAKPAPKSAAPVAATKAASPTLTSKEAKFTVEQTVLENGTAKGEPVTASAIEVKSFGTSTANVGVGVQYTRNLGNFESVKINVMINSPCYVEEIDSMFAQVLDKAKTKLEEAIEGLQIGNNSDSAEGTETEATEEGAPEEATDEAETASEEGGVDLEYLKTASEDDLKELANTNDLGVNPDDYTSEEDLRQVLIQAILGEDVLQEYIGSQEGAGEETSEEGTAEGYTEEELKKGDIKDLKEIFTAWDLGDFPKGPPNVAKNAAIKKILAAQSGE